MDVMAPPDTMRGTHGNGGPHVVMCAENQSKNNSMEMHDAPTLLRARVSMVGVC